MKFSYVRRGAGPVLVLQHGFLSGADYWHRQMEFFSGEFDVIAVTLPGFSDHAAAPAINRIEQFSGYLAGLLDHAGVDRFSLIGHSMGGMIAQQAALDLGARIDRLVLYGTGPIGELPGRFETLAASRARVVAEGADETLANTVATWFVDGRDARDYADGMVLARAASFDAVLGGYDAMAAWRSLERLGEIAAPTLVVWGDRDRSYRRDLVDALVAGIPDARLEVMTGCAHNAHLEQPERFNAVVAAFLKD